MSERITPYNEIRDKLRTGDRLDFISPGLIGKTISLFSARTHTTIIVRLREYEGEEKRRFFLEADAIRGFSLTRVSKRLEGYRGKIWWTPLRPEFEEARRYIGTEAFGMVGTRYDIEGLFGNLGGHVPEGIAALFCSEAVWIATRKGVIASNDPELAERVGADWMTINYKAARPGDFLNFDNTYLDPVRIAIESDKMPKPWPEPEEGDL